MEVYNPTDEYNLALFGGFYLGEHGWYDKRFIYDESFKTPLLVAWPGKVKAGTRSDELVQNLDFAQTFLEAAGVQSPADMQGESLIPLLTGNTALYLQPLSLLKD